MARCASLRYAFRAMKPPEEPPAGPERLGDVLRRLLDSPDLNLDELDEETRAAIAEARNVLKIVEEER